MQPSLKTLALLTALFTAGILSAVESPDLSPYPEAEEGQVRHVIVLPPLEEEADHQVELLVGKQILTDAVNLKRLGGEIEEKTIQGWGYSYYLADPGPVASTLMMPQPGEENVERLVRMPGKLIRYNSRLPIVIYTPSDAVVQYRIWSAGEVQTP
ncbi:MAG: ecotin family protein [Kiritimatiellia bacterium]